MPGTGQRYQPSPSYFQCHTHTNEVASPVQGAGVSFFEHTWLFTNSIAFDHWTSWEPTHYMEDTSGFPGTTPIGTSCAALEMEGGGIFMQRTREKFYIGNFESLLKLWENENGLHLDKGQ